MALSRSIYDILDILYILKSYPGAGIFIWGKASFCSYIKVTHGCIWLHTDYLCITYRLLGEDKLLEYVLYGAYVARCS